MKRFSIQEEFGAFFRREGYVVLTDLFAREMLADLLRSLHQLFEARFFGIAPEGLRGTELMEHYYEREKAMWRQSAARMCHLLPLVHLAGDQSLRSALRDAGLDRPILSTFPEVRTDMPGDTQYTQPWHQDWRYGQGSLNAVTIWTPLQDVDARNGTIELVPRSHLLGLLNCRELENPRRFEIDDPRLETERRIEARLNFGESIMFTQMLAHRSGVNSSGAPRLTFQYRYSDCSDKRFRDNGYSVAQSSDLVWSELPTSEAMAEIFGHAAESAS